ncbi:MAG TPA: UDP-3-O-(3-hydroxymyristoyl)glucosamine N-acyltransferase [Syntrophaceae bacterium]|nr:UDP-3-O-(3-hydroxymyristoyl)glucosamine N-acyltransferase [Syntrophaceae bacterium]
MDIKKSLKELAQMVGGQVVGDDTIIITGISGIREAKEGEITFVAHPKYFKEIDRTQASAIIVPDGIKEARKPLILTENPYLAYAKIANLFAQIPQIFKGISNEAIIGRNVALGKDVSIYPWVYVGHNVKVGDRSILFPFVFIGDDVSVGEDTKIYPNVSILEKCYIGNRVIIHSGAVIGSDGFGYAKDVDKYYKIPQIGIVHIDDDVEIGANTTIDRAALGKTWIKKGTKIDNLVQIGHNVVIGKNTAIVAQVGISGSTEIGNGVRLAGQVGIVGHVRIGDHAAVGAQSGVTKSVKDQEMVSGSPAIGHKDWLRLQGVLPKLPDMMRKLRHLEKRVQSLEKGQER